MKKLILGLIACVIIPASCSQKHMMGNKQEENEKVIGHRKDSITPEDATMDSGSDGISTTGSYDPRILWFLQNLHAALDSKKSNL